MRMPAQAPLLRGGETSGRADAIKLGDKLAHVPIELRSPACRNGCRSREAKTQWIVVLAIDMKLVVQVRTGGETGRTDIANDLTLLDETAFAQTGLEA